MTKLTCDLSKSVASFRNFNSSIDDAFVSMHCLVICSSILGATSNRASISLHLIEFHCQRRCPRLCFTLCYYKNLPEESFLSDLGEGDVNNLGSGVGAVAMEMLSSTAELANLVSP